MKIKTLLRRAITAKLLMITIAMVVVGACTTLSGMTPKQQYLAARIEFNTLQKQYLDAYDKATPDVQAICREKVDPLIDKMESGLDAWSVAVKDGVTADFGNEQFLAMKNQLIDMLAETLGGK